MVLILIVATLAVPGLDQLLTTILHKIFKILFNFSSIHIATNYFFISEFKKVIDNKIIN